MSEWIVPLVIFSTMGIVWLYNHFQEKRRRKKLLALAQELDIEYFDSLPQIDARHFSAFPISATGDQRRASNAFAADDGELRLTLFDFEAISGSGKNKNQQQYALGLVFSNSIQAPGMYIVANSWSLKVTNFFSKKQVELESDPQFTSDFRILGDDPEMIVTFLTHGRREALRKCQFKSFSSFGNTLLIELPPKKLKADELRNLLSNCLSLAVAMRSPSK